MRRKRRGVRVRSFNAGIISGCLLVLAVVSGGRDARGQGADGNVAAAIGPERVAALHAAEWIAAPGVPDRDWNVVQFRRVVEMGTVPAHVRVMVSADARFELRVNGVRVGMGPSYADLHHWRYEELDLQPAMRVGRNVVEATVWRFGRSGPVAQMGIGTAFLLAAEDAGERELNTRAPKKGEAAAPGWEVRREPGRTESATEFPDYHAAGPGERMDGLLMRWDWETGAGDGGAADAAAGWERPESRSRAALREEQDGPNEWMLMPDPIPAMLYEATTAGEVVRVTGDAAGLTAGPGLFRKPFEIPAHRTVQLLLDRKVLTTAFPEMVLSGGRGARLKVIYSEAMYDAKGQKGDRDAIEGRHIAGQTDEIVSDGGNGRRYEPLWWRAWRFLQVEVQTEDEPLRIDGLKAYESRYPFEAKGSFRSGDAELDKIWAVGWRTAEMCAHETYTDTPYWEQLQYIGDARIQALISYTVGGDDRLARQALMAYGDSLLPEGITQSRYPSALTQVIPPFSLLWVGMLRDFYEYRGDEAFVREVLPGTRWVMDWFARHQRADGMLGPVPWWPFVDWTDEFPGGVPPGAKEGGSALLTLQYLEALENGAVLEQRMGDAARASRYETEAKRVRAVLLKENWDAGRGLMADTPEHRHFSQQTNSLAVLLDVIPAAEQKAVMAKVLAVMPVGTSGVKPPMSDASYYFRFYVTKAMVHAGMGDEYVAQLEPWREMLKLHLSTWAEKPEPTRSDSHAWSAHPTYDLETIVAGVRPGSPGFGTVEVEPHLVGVTGPVEATVPTPRGDVHARYEKAGGGWSATVRLPEGVTGRLLWKGKATELRGGEQRVAMP